MGKEYPNILFAKDGEIFNMDGLKAVVIGGAYSIDKKYEPVEVFLSGVDQSRVDKSTEEWLDGIEDRLEYTIFKGEWFYDSN